MKLGPRSALTLVALGLGCSRSRTAPIVEAAAPSASVAPAPETPPDLVIFYSADLRGHTELLPKRAAAMDRARPVARAVVAVDAGDFVPAAGEDRPVDAGDSVERRTKILLAGYKRMGVAVVAPGERELALGPERLGALLQGANVRAVASNLVSRQGRSAFDADALIETDGGPVGVFGIVELPSESAALLDRFSVTASDPIEASRAAAKSLRERGAALIVGLFHVAGGSERVEKIVEQANGVDIAVVGHATGDAPRASAIGRTQVVSSGVDGSHVGRIDIRSIDAGARFENRAIGLDKTMPDQVGMLLLSQIDAERTRIAEEKAAAAERKRKGQKEPEFFETWTYGSNSACALCHEAVFAQWKTTDHATAMHVLKQSGHDKDLACVGCHATGYLLPGGTRNLEMATNGQFAEVGCEACHGPSALHVRSVDKKKGTSRKVEAAVCFGCHTPDQNLGSFEYAEALTAVIGPHHGAPAR